VCRECGSTVEPYIQEPCPSFGHEGRDFSIELSTTAHASASLVWERKRAFFVKNWVLLGLLLLVIVLTPAVGFFLSPVLSYVVSVVLGCLSFVL
jgi:hypothetical protein